MLDQLSLIIISALIIAIIIIIAILISRLKVSSFQFKLKCIGLEFSFAKTREEILIENKDKHIKETNYIKEN